MNPAVITPNTLAKLREVCTATLTTQLFKLGFRNTFIPGLQALSPRQRMVGEAATLRLVPAREDLATFDTISKPSYAQRVAIEGIQPGQVLVVEARGVMGAAAGGEVYMTRLKVLGAAGYVIDGCIRDYPAIQELGFPVYAKGAASPPHPVKHLAVEVNVPVGCAEVLVMPGDIMVGDGEGVVCVPRHVAEQVAESGAELDRLETFVLEKIRAGAPVPGTYPPNEATLKEYEVWKQWHK
ncbi:MAG: ribonuclease activity regulator RraA [Betaproteobacteria bacterium]|nr:ribonuclease activity regulator RraA [Betaproteobacteria bacterium]